uniref:Uncharacterized protein n=1 Tax=Canis lupus familiaris TaxID=9615 RepID=A0A8P0PLG7_CANLF
MGLPQLPTPARPGRTGSLLRFLPPRGLDPGRRQDFVPWAGLALSLRSEWHLASELCPPPPAPASVPRAPGFRDSRGAMDPRGCWGKSASPWLCGFLLFAACLGFYSNIFNLIPGWGQRRESERQEAGPVIPQRMLETRQCSDRDSHPDPCRVPKVPRMLYPNVQLLKPKRADVLVLTPWFAPIVWEGVFDSAILDAQFRNTTIGLTVFAIKKYVVFLELFLQTAEKHFMVGHRVIYYVFTDRRRCAPCAPCGREADRGPRGAKLCPLAGGVHAPHGDDQQFLTAALPP